MLCLTLLLAALGSAVCLLDWPPHLDVPTLAGPVRGSLELTHFQQRPYYAYRGIPYAQPPLAELRFRRPLPLPARSWSAPRECFRHGADCLQEASGPNGTTSLVGSEDCLTLNIYVPAGAGRDSPPLPILFFVFGGAWYRRSANSTSLLGPDPLIDEHVILVTANYRLGVLGLLATDAAETTGNWALHDQQLAMRWVQQNAAAFGGDPRQVTLGGQSSGSLSAQLHLQAPGSRGLFRRTIQMSTAFDSRATFRPPKVDIVPELYQLVADVEGQRPASHAELMVSLRRISAEHFPRRFPFVQFQSPILARIEPTSAQQPFLAGTDPALFALEGDFAPLDIDVLTGCTSNEAISQSSPTLFERFRSDPRVDIPSVHFRGDYEDWRYRWAERRIFARYFAKGARNASLAEYARLLSDVYQSYPNDRKVRQLAARNEGRTWQYQFDLDTRLNMMKRWTAGAQAAALLGAGHSDDMCYVFHCAGEYPRMYEGLTVDTEEYGLIAGMAGIYGRFVRGETLDWRPVNGGGWAETRFLRIEGVEWREEADALGGMRRFWDEIVKGFG